MTVRIFVLGFVQGVGFRRFIKKKAVSLGLTGYVRNTPDDRVEILVQGSREKIEKLKEIAEKGNLFSDVKAVVVEIEEKEMDYNSFELVF